MKFISFLLLGSVLHTQAQTHTMQAAITFGGGQSIGGTYTLNCAIIPLSMDMASGDAYAVITGPVGQVVSVPPSPKALPTMYIQPFESAVSISWEPQAKGFVLEATESLSPPAWTALPHGQASPVLVTVDGKPMFFRLRRIQ